MLKLTKLIKTKKNEQHRTSIFKKYTPKYSEPRTHIRELKTVNIRRKVYQRIR